MTTFPTLKARLQEASAPDRELDCLVFEALDNPDGWVKHPRAAADAPSWMQTEYWPSVEDFIRWRDDNADVQCRQVRFYTASVDAALELVERLLPGCQYNMSGPQISFLKNDEGQAYWTTKLTRYEGRINVVGQSPARLPLAILIALVSALEEQKS